MSKPYEHAVNSVKKFGGIVSDYLPIHSLFDISKSVIPDHRHRVLCHNSFFIGVLLERIPFPNSDPPIDGLYTTITNSEGKHISVRDIGEQHVLEDFNGFIPTLQDYIDHMEMIPWMNNGNGKPNSISRIKKGINEENSKNISVDFENHENKRSIEEKVADLKRRIDKSASLEDALYKKDKKDYYTSSNYDSSMVIDGRF